MFAGKPIIGIAGGIGSGKSLIASLFAEQGCLVHDADAEVRAAYEREDVRKTLRSWWGDEVFDSSGAVNRRAIARRVFASEEDRRRLEALLHPLVREARDRAMAAQAGDAEMPAFVWDIPLLFETGQAQACDAIVFVEAPIEQRLARVARTRGWTADQLIEREKLQMPLDKKLEKADYRIRNTADAAYARDQVREILTQIVKGLPVRHAGS